MWLMWGSFIHACNPQQRTVWENTWHNFVIEITRTKFGPAFIFFSKFATFCERKGNLAAKSMLVV